MKNIVKNISMPQFKEKDISRFWSKVLIAANKNECWMWQGEVETRGYGRINILKARIKSHRIAYYLHYKVDPKRLMVCHKCDNPLCCNPNHLFIGTQSDNMKDMVDKKRFASGEKHWSHLHPHLIQKGEKNGYSKLSSKQVIEIRGKYKSWGGTQEELAKIYGVSRRQIGVIVNNQQWKHLLPE